ALGAAGQNSSRSFTGAALQENSGRGREVFFSSTSFIELIGGYDGHSNSWLDETPLLNTGVFPQ
ncbi:MAG: hypothetical protein WAN23_13090, partial [Candidatus Acidiferrales bacterium]